MIRAGISICASHGVKMRMEADKLFFSLFSPERLSAPARQNQLPNHKKTPPWRKQGKTL